MKLNRNLLAALLALVLLLGAIPMKASAAGTTVCGIGFVNASSLKLRSATNTQAPVLATAAKGECVTVLAKVGDWYQVNYNLQTGYMFAQYLTVSSKENAELGSGLVTGSGVNLRSGPSTAASSLAVAGKGESCYIIGVNEGWYKVIYQNAACYIRSDYLELTEIPYENQASAKSPQYFRGGKAIGSLPVQSQKIPSSASALPAGVTGAQILAEAQKYIGCPYRAGGSSPSGFDCAGLVYYVLNQLGLAPYRSPADQYKMGTPVDKSSLIPGDLVFFRLTSGGSISHVGIYAGNGQFLHAPNSRSPVSYSSLTEGYWAEHYYGACRLASS